MKLQDAYVSESNAVGNWTRIGYKMDNNANFTYTGYTADASGGTTALANLAANTLGWQAENNVALNDCTVAAKCKRQLQMNSADGGNGVAYTPALSAAAGPLTPSFTKLGTAVAGTVQ